MDTPVAALRRSAMQAAQATAAAWGRPMLDPVTWVVEGVPGTRHVRLAPGWFEVPAALLRAARRCAPGRRRGW
jgi:hypothetical protein